MCRCGLGRKSCSPVTAPITPANALGTLMLVTLAKCFSPLTERLWMLVEKAVWAWATEPSKVTKPPPWATPVTLNPRLASHAVTLARSALLRPNWAAYCCGVSHWW